MVAIKTTGAVATTQSVVAGHAQKKGLTEQSSIICIGSFLSTGAPFQRAFPTIIAANQWLMSGAAADVDITRVESITFTQ